MTVGELREILEDFADDTEIVMSKDGEGNNFSPLADFSIGFYTPECSYYGEFVGEEYADEEEEWSPQEDTIKAICLWPTN